MGISQHKFYLFHHGIEICDFHDSNVSKFRSFLVFLFISILLEEFIITFVSWDVFVIPAFFFLKAGASKKDDDHRQKQQNEKFPTNLPSAFSATTKKEWELGWRLEPKKGYSFYSLKFHAPEDQGPDLISRTATR